MKSIRLTFVKIILGFLVAIPLFCTGQIYTETKLIGRLKSGGAIGEEVLSKRSIVLYSRTISEKQLSTIHENLVRAGIDAVAYFKLDAVLAGPDIVQAYDDYFTKREIANLVIIQKKEAGFVINITAFNGKADFVNTDQSSWSIESPSLNEALNYVYRNALASNKKKNLLMNEIPETDLPVKVIGGNRSEIFAVDLKVDMLAIPKFNDAELDKELEEILKSYPFKFQMVNPTDAEKDIRSKGTLYKLCFVHTGSKVAKELLGYAVGKSESAFVSLTYSDGQVQLKNIPAETPVFKFYVRHIDTGNIFLGPKWDAETTWQQALQNFIKGFKAELKIN
jgi:hypothetical protein